MNITQEKDEIFWPVFHPEVELRMVSLRAIETAQDQKIFETDPVVVDKQVAKVEHECTTLLSSPSLVSPFLK